MLTQWAADPRTHGTCDETPAARRARRARLDAQIHTRTMNCERDIRFELLGRLCPNSTGADIRSVCTEAGMYAIRARRKTVTEKDFLDAVTKVIKGYQKFSATPTYMVYN